LQEGVDSGLNDASLSDGVAVKVSKQHPTCLLIDDGLLLG
jgi:hypothetical protein